MENLSRAGLKVLREEINAALEDVAKKHNISIEAGSASFSPNNGSFKLEIATLGKGGVAVTPEVEALKHYKGILGLKFGFGDTFTSRGDSYKVTGLKPRSSKYPVIAENVVTGQSYKFPVETVNSKF